MSLLERQIVAIPMDALTDVDEGFGKQTRLDMSDLPESMEEIVLDMKDICTKKIQPMGVFYSIPVEKIEGEEIILTTGHRLHGGVLPLVFDKAFELIFYATTLNGFTDAMDRCDDATEQYFMDAWGTAYIDSASAWLKKEMERILEPQQVFLTNYWSPGQHNFPMDNQPALFDILKPEEIQIEMTESFMMHPTKSVSSVIGILKEKDERNLFPCDFCHRRETCHSAYGGNCTTQNEE